METWHDWEEFLKIMSAEYDLAKTEKNIFLTRYARDNISLTDEAIADLVMVEFETYRKGKSRIYTKFATSCTEINHKGRGKSKALQTWLETNYQAWRATRGIDMNITTVEIAPREQAQFTPPAPQPSIVTANPFIPLGGVVDQQELFFNRQQETKRIFELLNSRSSVALTGERSIGKSSLLKAICRQAPSQLQSPRQPIYLNLQDLENEDDFYSALCDKIPIPESRGYRLTRALRQHKILLILDEAEKMNWDGFTRQLRSQLRGLAEGYEAPLRLILASRTSINELFADNQDQDMTSPLAGICIEEKLKPWERETAQAFIHQRLQSTPIQFTATEIEQLITSSKGYPQQLMQLCHQLYNSYTQ